MVGTAAQRAAIQETQEHSDGIVAARIAEFGWLAASKSRKQLQ